MKQEDKAAITAVDGMAGWLRLGIQQVETLVASRPLTDAERQTVERVADAVERAADDLAKLGPLWQVIEANRSTG